MLRVNVEPGAATSVLEVPVAQVFLQSFEIGCKVLPDPRIVVRKSLTYAASLSVRNRHLGPEGIHPPVSGAFGDVVGLDKTHVGVFEQKFDRAVHPREIERPAIPIRIRLRNPCFVEQPDVLSVSGGGLDELLHTFPIERRIILDVGACVHVGEFVGEVPVGYGERLFG